MSNLTQTKVITPEVIQTFIEGHDPMERIVNITYSYQDDFVKIFYRNENDQKCVTKESYYPFVWATLSACQKLCNGDRNELKKLMATYNIGVKKLSNTNIHGEVIDEFNNGYLFMFFAKKPMKYGDFLNFFKLAKNPIYGKKNKDGKEVLRSNSESKQYLIVPPVEQFMISTGKRFFKGYDDYDQVYRMIFDLETEGLDPNRHRINQIGIRTNRGFEKIISVEGNTKEEKDVNELVAIDLILRIIYQYKPDIITAHNGENFDWSFIITRCEKLGTSMQEMSSKYFDGDFIKKDDRESILKLGGEMEKFRRTIVPNTTITDSLHAVRRAQAIDSNFLKADLKYSTEYLEMKKPNRVYVPGDKISSTWNDTTNSYALNNNNGDWYCITENKPLKDGYDIVTGKYIVERYLLDDIWECDKVEHKLNTSNFLICKMLPLTFSKCTTMGTAGQWKALMMAWSYENDLAIPMFGESKPFTGGLSRLLKVGFVDDVAKFDYNSLYPSIILTWKISDRNDLMGAMLSFLEYVLTQREKFKKLKKQASKKAGAIEKEMDTLEKNSAKYNELNNEYLKYTAEENFYDKQQLPMKIFGNSFFGSYGAPNVFPWGSLKCAEQTTCTGRQMLRLMISHFSEISQRYNLNDNDYNYSPIVGDSFTGDTPLYIKYKNSGLIDIKPIEQLINESSIEIDELGREYDYSKKEYYVLCRSGWVEPTYIYRHKTDKSIYRVTDGDTIVDVTEDHSLFNNKQEKIKPTEINENTKLEYYTNEIKKDDFTLKLLVHRNYDVIGKYVAKQVKGFEYIPCSVYNSTTKEMTDFYVSFMKNYKDDITYNKTVIAGLQYIKKMLKK
jgi:DNA polymerase elongation subunit (family B)